LSTTMVFWPTVWLPKVIFVMWLEYKKHSFS